MVPFLYMLYLLCMLGMPYMLYMLCMLCMLRMCGVYAACAVHAVYGTLCGVFFVYYLQLQSAIRKPTTPAQCPKHTAADSMRCMLWVCYVCWIR